MKNIFTRIAYERQEHRDLVMVTILSDEGSTPRGKGSMMLVGGGGQLLGTIGGGAVEKQSELRALRLLEERQSEVHGYRLRRNAAEDIGMVCGGDVDVHFQFIDADDARWDGFVREVLSRIDAQEPGVLVLKHDGSFPALADADGNTLAGEAAAEGQECTKVELPVMERAVIFGAGHCARALSPILQTAGFRVVIYDDREGFLDESRFPGTEARICGSFRSIGDHFEIGENDFAVVMTSGHKGDCDAEEYLLRHKTAYVGVIGSRKKTLAVNERLRAAGIPEEAIASVHTPIGLPIGAVTPEEIAVSIAAEMILVRAQQRAAKTGVPAHHCPV